MHTPVLLKEAIEILDPKPGEFFIDGTVGAGGHAAEILRKISSQGTLLGIDWDNKMLEIAQVEIGSQKNIILVQGNYADLPEILEKKKLGRADGLILDLGFSSPQIEESGKGFSFIKDEPLDMRYDAQTDISENQPSGTSLAFGGRENQHESAAVVINSYKEQDLAEIFWKFGEERFSRKIAQKIVEERKNKRIIGTLDLVDVIKKAVPKNYERGRIHPATRTFQALRIYVNGELENLETLLKSINKIIKHKGRVAIISFHSLEDRLVKNYFRELKNQEKAIILTKKPITPSDEEIKINPKSRSAKLRGIKLT